MKMTLLVSDRMIDRIITLLLITTTIILIATYQCWGYVNEHYGIHIYYIGVALSFVGYISVIVMLLYKHNYKKSVLIISDLILILSINNLLDELFFNPTKFQINEYISTGIILLLTIKKLIKR